ncbi:4Fe-4S binding protein, partial [Salmonella enterica]|uniref:4Fe-4S binding protein n=1 Tax=Salmonella enterica TaxID=28901 RepID=UPI0032B4D506
KDKGLFRRTVPDFDADTCTGCLDCTLVCPDAAIPGTVHEIHDLIATALDAADLTSTARDAARRHVHTLAARTRALLRAKDTRPF